MSTISVNPPKTPVTEGSGGTAFATTPNVCKMPGAPFTPTPLPNLGTSKDRLKKATKKVRFEKKKVAIRGSTFKSRPSGDLASKATGGGIISAKTEGKSNFLSPGSMDVKAEGKNIQLLGDATSNNGGSPKNAATFKELQKALGSKALADELCAAIKKSMEKGGRGQSKRAEDQFCEDKPDWDNQKHSFKLETKTPTGRVAKCLPDLYNSNTKKIIELKLCPGEALTPNQKQFVDELKRGVHDPPHTDDDFLIATPETCMTMMQKVKKKLIAMKKSIKVKIKKIKKQFQK